MKTFWRRDSPELQQTVVVRFTNSNDTAGEKAAMVDTDREEQGDPLVGVRSSPSCDTSLRTVETSGTHGNASDIRIQKTSLTSKDSVTGHIGFHTCHQQKTARSRCSPANSPHRPRQARFKGSFSRPSICTFNAAHIASKKCERRNY